MCLKFISFLLLFIPTTLFSAMTTTDSCSYTDTMHLPQCSNKILADIDTTTCLIGRHLSRYISAINEKSLSCSAAVSYIDKRYNTFTDNTTFQINYDHVQWLGDSTAPVTVIMYISMSCSRCKQVYKQLYDTLYSNPQLRKKMRLGIKYRSNTRYEKLLHATTKFNKQPVFLRRLADISGRIDGKTVKKVAQMVAIPYDSLITMAYLDANSLEVDRSTQEAIDNNVRFTPAVFINNHQYHSTQTVPWILDAVDYYSLYQH